MFKFENGDKVREVVSGFTGIITHRTQYMNGCNRYCVEPKVDKEGKERKAGFFDEQNLVKIRGGLNLVKDKKPALRRTGGTPTNQSPARH